MVLPIPTPQKQCDCNRHYKRRSYVRVSYGC